MANGAGGRSRPTRKAWLLTNRTSRFGWTSWVLLAVGVAILVAAIVLAVKASAGNFSVTLEGFVTDASLCDEDEDDDCTATQVSFEITDGDESTSVTLPKVLLPDKLKEGDPLKIEIAIDEARRIEANERMEIRKAKRDKTQKAAEP